VTTSIERHAGTTPVVGTMPTVGLIPTIPLSAAGTRPEPAVSVPSAMLTRLSATATADPELDPPEIRSGRHACRTGPCGLRVPTRPVANWSRFVLPTTIAPAPRSRATAVASASGRYPNAGQAAVVGKPATSMLSLTATSTPASGSRSPAATRSSTADASAATSSTSRRAIQISGRSTAAMRS
jgi:hypothetical protein